MDKVKSILSGGNKNHTDSTYDGDSSSQTANPNTGRLTGEGTHLGAATGKTDITSTAGDSTAGDSMTTTGPHSSDIMNRADPRVDSNATAGNTTGSDFANKAASTAWSSPSQNVRGQEDTSNPYATSSIDPRVDNTPRTQDTSVGSAPTTSATGPSYDQSTGTGLGSTTSDTTRTANNQSMMSRALGAVGLGGTAVRAENQAPSTTTGTDSYPTSTQTGGPLSHHRKESIPTTAYPSGTLDSPRAVAPPVGGPGSADTAAVADEPGVGDETGRAAVGQTSTYGSHYLGPGEPTSSVIDPNSSDPTTYRKPEIAHLGRDAGIGAGATAAGVGAASAYDRSRDQPPVQSGLQSNAPTATTGSEHAAFYDAATMGHQPTSASGVGSTEASQAHDTPSDRHLGRDAAAVGTGAGAVGAGAYEYEKHRDAQDPTAGTSTGVGATTGTTGTSQPYGQTGDRHLGRDAAAAGAGIGATGVGAHELSKHEEKKLEKEERHREKELAKEEKTHDHHHHHHHHRKEEAAVAAGTVGAGAVGAHEYEEREKERKPSLVQRILHPRSSRTSGPDDTADRGAADAVDSRAAGGYGDDAAMQKPNVTPAGYAAAPTKGYASHVTGGTGTTALAQGKSGPTGSHATALGNIFESKDPSVRSGSAPSYPSAEGQATGGTTYTEPPSTGYASQVTGSTGTPALTAGSAAEPLGSRSVGEGNLTGHHHGIHGSGLTRESMTGEPGTGHQFGEITDHKR